jgi:hypothetical protein
LRHDTLKGILRGVVHRAGISSTQEPGLAGGAGTSATGASTRVKARRDILLALPGGITIADISVTHPASTSKYQLYTELLRLNRSLEDQLQPSQYFLIIMVMDITHPLAINTLAAASTTAGAAAARRDQQKRYVLTSGAEWLSLCALLS